MRKFLLAFLITLFYTSVGAQTLLLVNPLEDWQKAYSFPLSDVRSLSFNEGRMNVELASAGITEIPLSEIAEIKFDSRGGIEAVGKISDLAFVYDRQTSRLRVDGLQCPTTLSVYSLEGRLCLSLTSYQGEDIDISSLPRGVYIVTVDSHSKKFVKS